MQVVLAGVALASIVLNVIQFMDARAAEPEPELIARDETDGRTLVVFNVGDEDARGCLVEGPDEAGARRRFGDPASVPAGGSAVFSLPEPYQSLAELLGADPPLFAGFLDFRLVCANSDPTEPVGFRYNEEGYLEPVMALELPVTTTSAAP